MNSLGKDIRQLLRSQLGVAGPNRVHKTVEYDLVYIYHLTPQKDKCERTL